MAKIDRRIDEYISKSPAYAKSILIYFRELIHEACPRVEETIKWGFPHFEYKGILCSFAAFKNHCTFHFWKADILPDPDGILKPVGESGMGSLGKITSLDDLPSQRIFKKYLKAACKLNDEGIKVEKKKAPALTNQEIPDYFLKALNKNKTAAGHFNSFSNSKKKDYITWLNDAKTEATRDKRLETAIEWISEGKSRNWKYEKK
jgi:uncharacterized protein YdeI (YjbR/CyaY-like superfamily)